MTEVKDISQIIASKGENPLVVSIISKQSEEYAKIECKLRKLKFKQELRKDWILFILRDVIIFSAIILFILAASGYSLFMHIYR
ncbi:hypothetical protein [Nostoc sp. TCL26-01]|uniref:hypothetical protein n=1 Tax=Nostoc sp. TCL26-01 TaxID=2576904 RepID=UPI0015BE7E37|nr:hypothetical protein [Nostoc sp. TCL26-01]QLE59703.1 hypothetical protein FD725_30155 [Nostoc sp. TCL26-01]